MQVAHQDQAVDRRNSERIVKTCFRVFSAEVFASVVRGDVCRGVEVKSLWRDVFEQLPRWRRKAPTTQRAAPTQSRHWAAEHLPLAAKHRVVVRKHRILIMGRDINDPYLCIRRLQVLGQPPSQCQYLFELILCLAIQKIGLLPLDSPLQSPVRRMT